MTPAQPQSAFARWFDSRFSTIAWATLAISALPAIWTISVFPKDVDGEFPDVVRPYFSSRPPAAYRLAEPGDTLDRVGLYIASACIALSVAGWRRSLGQSRRLNPWISAFAVSVAIAWFCATPWPTFDGWYGWGWQAIGNPSAPTRLRVILALCAIVLVVTGTLPLVVNRSEWRGQFVELRRRKCVGLFLLGFFLLAARFVPWPPIEPIGYWPRWCLIWGMMAFGTVLIRLQPELRGGRWLSRYAPAAIACLALIWGGLRVIEHHRVIPRLRTVVPGRVYISAMPDYRTLSIAQERHHFKTIINLFPENTPQRSPLLDGEYRFAQERGLTLVMNPGDPAGSDEFLQKTLDIARDPNAWPILVHCHACMDRAPSWMGIYRFVVQGWPLDAILRETEQHRGLRPKASVTLLFNQVLPWLAPERYERDPTAQLLRQCARGTITKRDMTNLADGVAPPSRSRREKPAVAR